MFLKSYISMHPKPRSSLVFSLRIIVEMPYFRRNERRFVYSKRLENLANSFDTQQTQIRITVVNAMANLAAEIATGA